MLPQAYEPAAALLLVLGGALACFAGYRVFRLVLGIYGFILGAFIASSIPAANNTIGLIVAAIVGGVVGAVILVLAYFVAIALVGAAVGAVIAHVTWTTLPHIGWAQTAGGDPPALLVIGLAVAGAVAAMVLQRYVIIVGTAFGGAWTLVIGAIALSRGPGALRPAAANHVWILYPLDPAPGERWVPLAWVALGVIGTAVQLGVTGRRR